MDYLEAGFNRLLQKSTYQSNEMTEDKASSTIINLTGSSIAGGATTSANGRLEINWNTGTILISDGANPRILIGYQAGGFANE